VEVTAETTMLSSHLTTKHPQTILQPRPSSWKDKAHLTFKLAAGSVYVVGGLFAMANGLNYISEENPTYQNVNIGVAVAFATDIVYGLLQQAGFLLER